MTKYRLKPENVEAVKFDGKNWFAVKQLLGPHLTKEVPVWEKTVDYFVFDIETKDWFQVVPDVYVVRDDNGAVDVVGARDFEAKWEVDPPVFTQPWVTTFPGGGGVLGTNG